MIQQKNILLFFGGDNIPKITKTLLAKAINNCIKYNDPETARNYIRTWGPHIKDYNIEEELQKFETELNKTQKTKKLFEKEE